MTNPLSPNSTIGERVDDIVGQTEEPKNASSRLKDLMFGFGMGAIFCITTSSMLLLIIFAPVLVFGWEPSVISSDSMSPQVERGDVVLFKKHDGSSLDNAVVQFADPLGEGTIVHRIVGVEPRSGDYITQGDANGSPDSTVVADADILGVGAVLVPVVGHLQLWVSERQLVPSGISLFVALLVLGPGFAAARSGKSGETDDEIGPLTPAAAFSTGASLQLFEDIHLGPKSDQIGVPT